MNFNPGKLCCLLGLHLVALALPASATDSAVDSQRPVDTGQVVSVQIHGQAADAEEDACADRELAIPRGSGELRLVVHADCGLSRVHWRQLR